jgi:hypothetical protein
MLITKDNYEIWFLDFAEGRLSDEQKESVNAFVKNNPELEQEFHQLLNHWEALSLESSDTTLNNDDKAGMRFDRISSMQETDRLLIGELEGDLNLHEKARLSELILANGELLAQRTRFQKTHLAPVTEKSKIFSYLTYSGHADMNDPSMLLAGEVDDTLNHNERLRLNQFLASNDAWREARGYFAKTKLDPQWHGWLGVVYEEKSSLHQKTRAAGVIRLLFPVAAAAASLTLLFWLFYHEPSQQPSVAENHSISIPEYHPAPPVFDQNMASTEGQKQGMQNPSSVANKPSPHQVQPSKQQIAAQINDVQTPPVPKNEYFSSIEPQRAGFDHQEILAPFTHLSPNMSVVLGKPIERSVNEINTYLSIPEYAAKEMKKTLWGSEDYPKQDFGLALAQKGINKVFASNKREEVVVEKIQTPQKREFKLRIGRFEYSRVRK